MTETGDAAGSSSTDYAAAYRDLRLRVTELLSDRPDAVLEQVAPATPEWRVRDVVAHLGGVCDDIARGNMDGVTTNPWTQAQVDKRREWPFVRVLDDWSEHAAVVEPMMNAIGHPMGQMVFDAWTHEQDVRGALGEPGARDGAAIDISWDWFVETNGSVTTTRPAAMLAVTEIGESMLGGGVPVATVRASRFEFLRAITGRRSRAQVQRFDVDGAELDSLILFGDIFSPAAHDIVE